MSDVLVTPSIPTHVEEYLVGDDADTVGTTQRPATCVYCDPVSISPDQLVDSSTVSVPDTLGRLARCQCAGSEAGCDTPSVRGHPQWAAGDAPRTVLASAPCARASDPPTTTATVTSKRGDRPVCDMCPPGDVGWKHGDIAIASSAARFRASPRERKPTLRRLLAGSTIAARRQGRAGRGVILLSWRTCGGANRCSPLGRRVTTMPADLRDLSRWPVVVAPMSGGPTTPELVASAAQAGALGFLASGYKTAAAMDADLAALRAISGAAFGVNLFVPQPSTADPARVAAYIETLDADAGRLRTAPGLPVWDDDDWGAKIASLLANPPAIVSFTFGCPSDAVVAEFHARDTTIVITVTTPDEAMLAVAVGADLLCAQGFEAGAHRGTFANADRLEQDFGLLALIGEIQRVTGVPIIAAGGIAGPREVAAVFAAGAIAVQAGTAFLRCPRAAPAPPTGTRSWTLATRARPSLEPSPAGVLGDWSTSSCSTIPTLPRPTRRSTMSPARSGPLRLQPTMPIG